MNEPSDLTAGGHTQLSGSGRTCITCRKSDYLLVPKLQLGNPVLEALASRICEARASRTAFPSWSLGTSGIRLYYYTIPTERRARILGNDLTRDLLRAAFRNCLQRWPAFRVDAMVMLPDHLHAIWTLPPGDSDYSKRWGAIKKHFTEDWLALGRAEKPRSESRIRYRRRGVWQRRFIEHTLCDENDDARHFDDIHYNPVKHGLVACPRDWPYSTFHRWVKNGIYAPHWGCASGGVLDFSDLDEMLVE